MWNVLRTCGTPVNRDALRKDIADCFQGGYGVSGVENAIGVWLIGLDFVETVNSNQDYDVKPWSASVEEEFSKKARYLVSSVESLIPA